MDEPNWRALALLRSWCLLRSVILSSLRFVGLGRTESTKSLVSSIGTSQQQAICCLSYIGIRNIVSEHRNNRSSVVSHTYIGIRNIVLEHRNNRPSVVSHTSVFATSYWNIATTGHLLSLIHRYSQHRIATSQQQAICCLSYIGSRNRIATLLLFVFRISFSSVTQQ